MIGTGGECYQPRRGLLPEAFHAFVDELLAGPERELNSLDAAEALRELRVDARAWSLSTILNWSISTNGVTPLVGGLRAADRARRVGTDPIGEGPPRRHGCSLLS